MATQPSTSPKSTAAPAAKHGSSSSEEDLEQMYQPQQVHDHTKSSVKKKVSTRQELLKNIQSKFGEPTFQQFDAVFMFAVENGKQYLEEMINEKGNKHQQVTNQKNECQINKNDEHVDNLFQSAKYQFPELESYFGQTIPFRRDANSMIRTRRFGDAEQKFRQLMQQNIIGTNTIEFSMTVAALALLNMDIRLGNRKAFDRYAWLWFRRCATIKRQPNSTIAERLANILFRDLKRNIANQCRTMTQWTVKFTQEKMRMVDDILLFEAFAIHHKDTKGMITYKRFKSLRRMLTDMLITESALVDDWVHEMESIVGTSEHLEKNVDNMPQLVVNLFDHVSIVDGPNQSLVTRESIGKNMILFAEPLIAFRPFSGSMHNLCGRCHRKLRERVTNSCSTCNRIMFCDDICHHGWQHSTNCEAINAKLYHSLLMQLTMADPKIWSIVFKRYGDSIPICSDMKLDLSLLIDTIYISHIKIGGGLRSPGEIYSWLYRLSQHPQIYLSLTEHDCCTLDKRQQVQKLDAFRFGAGIGLIGGTILSYSCQPNVYRRFNKESGTIEYISRRYLKQGEQLTLDIGFPISNNRQRKKVIQKTVARILNIPPCSCSWCSQRNY